MHEVEKVEGLLSGGAGYAEPQGSLLHAHGQKFRHGEGHAPIEHELLGHVAYAQARLLMPIPVVQRNSPGKHREERRLAHAVAAHEGEPVALLHEKFGIIQKRSVAERKAGILNGKKSHDGIT